MRSRRLSRTKHRRWKTCPLRRTSGLLRWRVEVNSGSTKTLHAKMSSAAVDPLIAAFPGLYGRLHDDLLPASAARLKAVASMLLAKRPVVIVCVERPSPLLRVLWGLKHMEPSVIHPTELDDTVVAFANDVVHKCLPSSCRVEAAWMEFEEVRQPTAAVMTAGVTATPAGQRLLARAVERDYAALVALLTIVPLFLVVPLLTVPYMARVQA